MTLQEIRDKIAATKAKLREVLPNAETDEQRAEVSTLEERLNARGSGADGCPEVGRAATASPVPVVYRGSD